MPAKKKRRRVKVHLVKQNHRLTFRKEQKKKTANKIVTAHTEKMSKTVAYGLLF